MVVVALPEPTDWMLSTGLCECTWEWPVVHVEVGAIIPMSVTHVGDTEEWSVIACVTFETSVEVGSERVWSEPA